ncbi:ribonuclease D [Deltaproteobacteria bacterium]|nr:ribonuclease D [Deltaproteobacteria bacterium]
MPVLIRTTAELLVRLPALAGAPSIALDTEFHPEKYYTPRLMLVQLRPAGREALLIDALADVDLRPLGPILSATTLLVHGGAADLSLLHLHAGASPTKVIDTQLAAAFCGMGWPRRLQDLVHLALGRTLTKQETLSDWSRRPLSPDQLRYAADDVEGLHELVAALLERITQLGNLAWFEAAQAEAVATALKPPPPEDAWRRVPGAHLLSDRERAALQALAAWRQERAIAADIPLNHVVADAVMFDLARRRPTTVEELRENRRMPSNVWKQAGDAVLAALREAERAPPPSPLRRGSRCDALRLGARIVAAASGMEGDLLLNDCELDYILGGTRSKSWRRQALGPVFDEFVAGTRWIDGNGTLISAPI